MASNPINLQREITATGLLKSVAGETQGAPNSIVAATPSNGTAEGDYVPPDDPRLSDARTPTAHKSSHAMGGGDALSPADIGAAPASHQHTISDITGYSPSANDVGLSVADGRVCATYTPPELPNPPLWPGQ